MPRLMRIWRTTEEDGFNREADTDQVAAESQHEIYIVSFVFFFFSFSR